MERYLHPNLIDIVVFDYIPFPVSTRTHTHTHNEDDKSFTWNISYFDSSSEIGRVAGYAILSYGDRYEKLHHYGALRKSGVISPLPPVNGADRIFEPLCLILPIGPILSTYYVHGQFLQKLLMSWVFKYRCLIEPFCLSDFSRIGSDSPEY